MSILPILKQVVICGVVAVVIIFSDTECETGLVKVQNVCKETCAVRPCKELIQNICLFLYVGNVKTLNKHVKTKCSKMGYLYIFYQPFRILVPIPTTVLTQMEMMNTSVNAMMDTTERFANLSVI